MAITKISDSEFEQTDEVKTMGTVQDVRGRLRQLKDQKAATVAYYDQQIAELRALIAEVKAAGLDVPAED